MVCIYCTSTCAASNGGATHKYSACTPIIRTQVMLKLCIRAIITSHPTVHHPLRIKYHSVLALKHSYILNHLLISLFPHSINRCHLLYSVWSLSFHGCWLSFVHNYSSCLGTVYVCHSRTVTVPGTAHGSIPQPSTSALSSDLMFELFMLTLDWLFYTVVQSTGV